MDRGTRNPEASQTAFCVNKIHLYWTLPLRETSIPAVEQVNGLHLLQKHYVLQITCIISNHRPAHLITFMELRFSQVLMEFPFILLHPSFIRSLIQMSIPIRLLPPSPILPLPLLIRIQTTIHIRLPLLILLSMATLKWPFR